MKTRLFFTLLVSFVAFVSCKQTETMYYEGGEMISFYRGRYEPDSMSYTFAFHPIAKQKDTVYVKMRVQGTRQPKARLIKVIAAEGSTAKVGEDFLLPEVFLPADSLTINYPVVVFNTEKLKNTSLKLVLNVAPSSDFLPGANGREIAGTYAMTTYKIWFSNKAEKPAYWGDIEYYFGAFSSARLQFMIQTLGITNFSDEAIGAYGLYTYPVQLRKALAKYVAENGPLIDEFGEEVTF